MASGTDEKPSIILMPLLPILAIPTIISETEVIVKKPAGAIHSWVVWLQLHYPIETMGIVASSNRMAACNPATNTTGIQANL